MKTFLNMKTSQGRETVDQFDKVEGQTAKEYRTIESVSFAHAMGENGGFYKVQLIDDSGVIIAEWKA